MRKRFCNSAISFTVSHIFVQNRPLLLSQNHGFLLRSFFFVSLSWFIVLLMLHLRSIEIRHSHTYATSRIIRVTKSSSLVCFFLQLFSISSFDFSRLSALHPELNSLKCWLVSFVIFSYWRRGELAMFWRKLNWGKLWPNARKSWSAQKR